MFDNFDINDLPLPPNLKEALSNFKKVEDSGIEDWGKHKNFVKELTGLSYAAFVTVEMVARIRDETFLLRHLSQLITYAFLLGRRAGLAEAVFTAPVEENNDEIPNS